MSQQLVQYRASESFLQSDLSVVEIFGTPFICTALILISFARYTVTKTMSVILITTGVITTKSLSSSTSPVDPYTCGILTLALVLLYGPRPRLDIFQVHSTIFIISETELRSRDLKAHHGKNLCYLCFTSTFSGLRFLSFYLFCPIWQLSWNS